MFKASYIKGREKENQVLEEIRHSCSFIMHLTIKLWLI